MGWVLTFSINSTVGYSTAWQPSKKIKPMNTNGSLKHVFIKTCFLQCLGKATLKHQNLFNCCSNQGLRLRSWAMRHASILRRAISSDSTSMSRVEALELLSKMLTFMKIWVAEHVYTQCSKFCQKMVMHDANDHNGHV